MAGNAILAMASFEKFSGGPCLRTPLPGEGEGQRHFLTAVWLETIFCHPILKCHSHMFEKVGRYVHRFHDWENSICTIYTTLNLLQTSKNNQ